MKKRRRHKGTVKRFYNHDAGRFLELAKLRKAQEAELEEMDRSFDLDISDFEYSLASDGNQTERREV